MDAYDQYLQAEGFDVDSPPTKTGNDNTGVTADWLLKLGTTAATTYRDWDKPAPAPQRAAAAKPANNWMKNPAVIGGAILGVVLLAVLVLKRK